MTLEPYAFALLVDAPTGVPPVGIFERYGVLGILVGAFLWGFRYLVWELITDRLKKADDLAERQQARLDSLIKDFHAALERRDEKLGELTDVVATVADLIRSQTKQLQNPKH